MPKIWTVFDDRSLTELGAYWHEDEALQRKKEYVENMECDEDDILIDSFTVHQ